MLKSLLLDIMSEARMDRVPILQKFFQTHKWWYAEGDKFFWLYVPEQRKIAKKYYKNLKLDDVKKLLDSEFHEHRFVGLIILNLHFQNSKTDISQKEIFDFYIENLDRVNNWDLVDVTAPIIVGEFLWDSYLEESKDPFSDSGFFTIRDSEWQRILDRLAGLEHLWSRRVAIVSTLKFIRNGYIDKTLDLCERLINDEHHLIHKACGWMLREAWKVQTGPVEWFLNKFAMKMPRTMLRYSIEQMSDEKRKFYLVLK